MVPLNLPEYGMRLKNDGDQQWIYDTQRKKFVLLTPEEWVRQHFLNYLIVYLHYPRSLIKVESGLKINKLGKRSDIIVYDRSTQPYMLIECKSTDVQLSQAVFDQVSSYNQAYQARYLVITNGLQHYCCQLDYQSNQYQFIKKIPGFSQD